MRMSKPSSKKRKPTIRTV
ncbi:hypothetical protein Goshw_024411 [Gossypium schwendimanii]|uniref:Uncharacterized protein n=1 Tax=Gossypium schwendimanii TaxID=34291 RepID=A0A7J9LYN5_GOSSC|nr:hypothetical protein [Gossypium schwendimanii]